jgi:signal peptidase I
MSEFDSNPVHEQELEAPTHDMPGSHVEGPVVGESGQAVAPDRVSPDPEQPQFEPAPILPEAEQSAAATELDPAPIDDAEFAFTMDSPGAITTAPIPVPARQMSVAASSMAVLQSLAITVAIAVFVITFIVQAFQIPSQSMESTLLVGDYLLVDKVHYGPGGFWSMLEPYEPIRHGDIIVFKYPVNPTQHFVKRVIGVPGDRVRLINKRVFVNGKMLTEPYVTYSRPFSEYQDNFPVVGAYDPNMEAAWGIQMRKLVEGHELIVPEDSYFVLGDNRDQSLDSRYWGFVPRENVVGRPLLIYFSMRKPIEVTTPLSSFSDKLHDLTYNLSDLSGRIRWRRAFRLIK